MPRNDGTETEEYAGHRDDGAGRDVAGELSGVAYVRLTQRVAPRGGRRNTWLLVALVVLAHALLGWLAYLILRPASFHEDRSDVVSIALIDTSSGLPAPPPPVPPPPLPGQPAPAPRPLVHREAPAKGAISATLEGVKTPSLQLYDSTGRVRVPFNGSRPAAPAPAYSAPGLQGSQIYGGKSPVPYKPTRFNKDWAPDHESLGAKTIGRAVDKAIEKTTVSKTVHLPGGIKLHCALSPLALLAGCKGEDPQPPPSNDDDIRLSMPPAETLTGKKVPLPGASASSAKPASSSSSAKPASSSSSAKPASSSSSAKPASSSSSVKPASVDH